MKKSIKKSILGGIILLAVLWVGCEDATGVESAWFFFSKVVALALAALCAMRLRVLYR